MSNRTLTICCATVIILISCFYWKIYFGSIFSTLTPSDQTQIITSYLTSVSLIAVFTGLILNYRQTAGENKSRELETFLIVLDKAMLRLTNIESEYWELFRKSSTEKKYSSELKRELLSIKGLPEGKLIFITMKSYISLYDWLTNKAENIDDIKDRTAIFFEGTSQAETYKFFKDVI